MQAVRLCLHMDPIVMYVVRASIYCLFASSIGIIILQPLPECADFLPVAVEPESSLVHTFF